MAGAVKSTTGRAVTPIMVRPRSSEQRAALASAAKAAGVSLSYYLLESALMVAQHEGFSAPAVRGGWQPPSLPGGPAPRARRADPRRA